MNKKVRLLGSKHLKIILKVIFAIAFIGIIIYEGRKELTSINLEELKGILKSLPIYKHVLFSAGGILVTFTSLIHDVIISKELSVRLSKIKIFRIGLISNTLNNILGGVSSAGLRAILYVKEGVKPKEATYYNILIVTSFSTGLSALTVIILFNLSSIRSIFEQYEFALIATIIIIFYLPLFFLINKFKWMKEKLLGEDAKQSISYHLLAKLFICSLIEWTVTAFFFCLIALNFSPNANLIDIFSIFIISSAIGVVSLVPGAIGSFDIALILGMTSINSNSHKAVASLIIFRLFYYILPLILASFVAIPQFFGKSKNKRSRI